MDDKPDTRERLVEAARVLFLQQGYNATGIAEILKAAEARSGSLYYFFPTKEDLLLAVLEKYKQMLCPHVVQPVLDRVSDPIERIFALMDGYRQMLLLTQFTCGCPIGNLAIELCESHPNARKLIVENFEAWLAVVEQWLVDAAGKLPAGSDPKQIARFVLTTMEGAVMLARSYRSIDPYDSAVTQLRSYFELKLKRGTDWPA